MKIVQLNGGPLSEFKLYIGPVRELTVETTNWELRLHNEATPGGIRFLNLTQNDQRYQGRQAELDGFNFGANAKGFVTRVSPGVYKLRTLTVNTDSLDLIHPQGLLANPRLALAPVIASDHIFAGEVEFTSAETTGVKWVGAVEGDVVGDTTGTHTGDVTGDVTGDLLGNTFGTHTGSLDTSGGDLLMAAGQIQLAWLGADVIEFITRRGVDVGGIIQWAGTLDDIPDNWALCDGFNGTPDLSKSFIVAAATDLLPHTTGGSNSHDHAIDSSGPHSHTGEAEGTSLTIGQLPVHSHLNGVVDKNDNLFNHGGAAAVPTRTSSIDGNSSNGIREGYTTEAGSGEAHTHTLSVDPSSGSHIHGRASVSDESNVPEYYALAFIMKVA